MTALLSEFEPWLFWVVVDKTEIPGIWYAHVLELDLVTQGESVRDALVQVREAVEIIFEDDHERGLDPNRRRASPRFWTELDKHIANGAQSRERLEKNEGPFVTLMTLQLCKRKEKHG